MDKITHAVYAKYPEQPYISPERDLVAWEEAPEDFPYGIIEKKQMVRLPEGLLPGHIIMLWRIHFGNFTTQTIIPQYFEYRYGVDSREVLDTLTNQGYIKLADAKKSLPLLTVAKLKKILLVNKLPIQGKKEALLYTLTQHIDDDALNQAFSLRLYQITPKGSSLLNKYPHIITRHGPKS